MKRSEMLEIIGRAIEMTIGCNPDTGDKLYPSSNYIAFVVLHEIEKSGMLPPHNPPEKLSIIQDEPYYTKYYTWEPEDDE